jgi:DNA-directed RNA polymerase specialized sigma24 family protein
MGSFLLRLSAGEYELNSEDDLRTLLASIAKNKFMMLNRYETAAKRNHLITEPLSKHPKLAAKNRFDPAEKLVFNELQNELTKRMSAGELELLRLRRDGESWATIAIKLSEEQQVLRKRLSRAINRVASELGLEFDLE